jgi:HSP20 family molecular chaperone IbpA
METNHFEETLAEGKSNLHVMVEIGDVDIRPHDSRSVVVDAESQHMDVTVRRENNTVYVRAERQEAWNELSRKAKRLLQNSEPPRANLSIRVPEECEVRAKTITGKLSVSDVDAPINTHVITGSTTLDELGGPIFAKTVTGSVRYHGPLADAKHRFEATSGKICLSLTQEPNARLNARTTTGSIRCDFPIGDEIERRHITGARLNGILGSGKGDIRAKVVTGSLHLESA